MLCYFGSSVYSTSFSQASEALHSDQTPSVDPCDSPRLGGLTGQMVLPRPQTHFQNNTMCGVKDFQGPEQIKIITGDKKEAETRSPPKDATGAFKSSEARCILLMSLL